MGLTYKFDTFNYSLNGEESQKLDFHRPVSRLELILSITDYNTGAAGATRYDAHPCNLIDTITIGEGTRFPIAVKGRDLFFLSWLMNKVKPTETLLTSANAANKTAEGFYPLPLPLNKGAFTNPKLKIEWSGDLTGDLGNDQTVDSASVNGSVDYQDTPVPEFSLFADTTLLNKSGGTVKSEIPAEGRLSKVLIMSRNQSSKNLANTALDDVSVRIEGISYYEKQWRNLEASMQNFTDDNAIAGVGLIDLTDTLPLIGNSSYVYIEVGGTAMDLTVYYLFEGVNQAAKVPTNQEATAGAQSQAPPASKGGLPSTTPLPGLALRSPFTPRKLFR